LSKSGYFDPHLDGNRSVFVQIYGFYPTFGRKSLFLSFFRFIFAIKNNGDDIAVGLKPCGANANYTNSSNFCE
jgi:hypothetical protein